MIFLFAISYGCVFTSCEKSLEKETLGLSCDNKERRSMLLGTYVGRVSFNGWAPDDFTIRLSLSNIDCVKIGINNSQGWMTDFEGEIVEDRIVLSSEKVLEKQGDHCNGSYGNSISVTLATSGSVNILEDNEQIELEFDFNQTQSNMNGEALCKVDYGGILVKQ